MIIGAMSLTDKRSDVSQNLRKLLLAFRQKDQIDLTPLIGDAPFLVMHKPQECPTCTEAHEGLRELQTAHGWLIDKDGYVNEEVLVKIPTDQQQRLREIGQRLDAHLKEFYNQEVARLKRTAAERGGWQF